MNAIKKLREEMGIDQAYLARKISVSQPTVSDWENNRKMPSNKSAVKLAEFFGVSVDYILGRENFPLPGVTIPNAKNIMPLPKTKKLPLLGTIACGEPIYADENIEGYLPAPEDVQADFCLRCKGDSMIGARIFNGDVVYIRSQPSVDNGQIAAVLIGDEATLKRVYISGDKITLAAANESYEPLMYVGAETEQIRILGLAVAFLSRVK